MNKARWTMGKRFRPQTRCWWFATVALLAISLSPSSRALPLYYSSHLDLGMVDITKTLHHETAWAHNPMGDSYNNEYGMAEYKFYYCECRISIFDSSVTNLVLKDRADLQLDPHDVYAYRYPHHFIWYEGVYKHNGNMVWADSINYLLVTAVKANACKGRTKLQHVRLPDTCRTIGNHAFDGCTALASVELQEGLESIGDYAFANCTALESIVIPNSVTHIGENAFYGCTGLQTVVWPERVEDIPDYAFYGCTGLESVVLGSGVKAIGNRAFACSGLTAAVIPDGVESVGQEAFSSCGKLVSISFGNGVKEIGSKVVSGSTNLVSLTVGAGNGTYKAEDNLLLTADGARLVAVPGGLPAVKIPAGTNVIGQEVRPGVIVIGAYAFAQCSRLQQVEIPASVEYIEESAFENCTGLTEIVLPYNLEAIGESAFSGCTGLVSLNIPWHVSSLGAGAFRGCDSLAALHVPESVEHVGEQAFAAKGLEMLYVPEAWEGTDMLAEAGVPKRCRIIYVETGNGNWYVDANSKTVSGDGKNPMTAFRTLEEGLAAAGENDTLWLSPGYYDGNVEAGMLWRFRGAVRGLGGAGKTIIEGLPEGEELMVTALSDVTIRNARGSIGEAWGAKLPVIERCIITGCRSDRSDHPLVRAEEIRDCLVAGNECGDTASVLVVAKRIVGSTLADNRAPYGLLPETCAVFNSILWNNLETCGGRLANYTAAEDGYWEENTSNWVATGMLCTTLSNCCVNPNSMYGEDGDEKDWSGGLSDPRSGLAVLFSNPDFLDAATGDYRLAPDSPCIDAGAPEWATGGMDVVGNARIQGTAPDIGCFEVAVPTATSNTPVSVEYGWLELNTPDLLADNGGNYEAAANAPAANGRPVWECYVAGVSVTDPAENFKTVLEWENGQWIPKPSPDRGYARTYTVQGAVELGGEEAWGPVTPDSRFFRVKVALPPSE